MQIEFVGAARTVTGSKHLVRTAEATVLLDCGLFQGRRRESLERNRHLGIEIGELDAVVLSHAHIDHSGALPSLVRLGYEGPIYTTPATRDLAAALLADSAYLQAADARYINKVIERDGAAMEPVTPLYDSDDVARTMSQTVSVPYHRRQVIAPGIELTFHDAGHVLGSAITVLDVTEDDVRTRLAFTGDLGRCGAPILRDPEIPAGVDVLLTESTYGDRRHPPLREAEDALEAVLRRAHARGGKVLIPAFALERAQEIVYAFARLAASGRLPPMPIWVDSPLTVKITDVFKLHPDCYDAEARQLLASGRSPFDVPGLGWVTEVEESKRLDAEPGPAVIVSASGMCEGGRIVHHLRAAIEDERNVVVLVGFQAQHTLGRRIAERRPEVKIFGIEHPLRAEVVVVEGFSAHADQSELVAFAEAVRERGRLRQVFLVHGEPPAQDALAARLGAAGFPDVRAPAPGTVATLGWPATRVPAPLRRQPLPRRGQRG